ncbi:MAG: diguanylate cyclase/phosphodiesterase & domain with sensor(s) [Ilumatobacteraceae bacterium]|nr:diguanylate cyclase/phosphodiesterase & domain with sensor(s) [Ilumatobacteraceae bacterium]
MIAERDRADDVARRPLVFVVDDEPAVRTIYLRVLERAGFATGAAGSGAEALRTLTHQAVDAVVLDQQMPGMTGLQLLAAIRLLPLHDRTPVLFVSGDRQSEMRISALHAGATDFMVKPVELAELVARVSAQVRMGVTWRRTLNSLSRRADAVASLADLTAHPDPHVTAALLCERIARAHVGASVGIYQARANGSYVSMAAVGAQPLFLGDAPPARRSHHIGGQPWIDLELSQLRESGGTWWACAPLRRQDRMLGLLVLGRTVTSGDLDETAQLLAAAVDYAAVAALHLEVGLADAVGLRLKQEALDEIIAARAFWPVFQPVASLDDGTVIGYEALTRFADGTPPDQHLAEAAEAGMGAELEMAMLAAAIASSGSLPRGTWLSCNISPHVLLAHRVEIHTLIESTGRSVVVELTEHSPINDYALVREAVADLGPDVLLAVDDAGAGFASLRHVVDLHPHFMKLDRSWVTRIDSDHSRQALVAGLVGFCARTGTRMIAEGIERAEEKAVLQQLGVLYGQGYLLGKPLPLADINALRPVPPPAAPVLRLADCSPGEVRRG